VVSVSVTWRNFFFFLWKEQVGLGNYVDDEDDDSIQEQNRSNWIMRKDCLRVMGASLSVVVVVSSRIRVTVTETASSPALLHPSC
jgi:hypothetical protein